MPVKEEEEKEECNRNNADRSETSCGAL